MIAGQGWRDEAAQKEADSSRLKVMPLEGFTFANKSTKTVAVRNSHRFSGLSLFAMRQ